MTSYLARNELGYLLLSFEPALEHQLDHDHETPLNASFVLVERGGQVLLVFDNWRKHWELPGGGRDAGESPRSAAVRELAEETGVVTEELIFVGVSSYESPPDGLHERVAVYRTVLDPSGPDPVPLFQPDKEIGGTRWWDPASSREGVDPLDAMIIDLVLADPTAAPTPLDVTRGSYQAAADVYTQRSRPSGIGKLAIFLDRFAAFVAEGRVLEVGSGPGWDAAHLEDLGLTVQRTDITPAFVEMMRAEGHDAYLLDVRSDDLGGPWDGVLANAVLLHLNRAEFTVVLQRIAVAVRDGGIFAFTLKEGDGDSWSEDKLGSPRWFVYWREPAVRAELRAAGWTVISVDHHTGTRGDWLHILARR
ncbi:NUDIX domain-containing protein [Microlunatus endophyticus]|uniref:NUDIX domain-containing protein n=1 Tax=Microlunatus endophyticus TaxID=1716077 RepID=UPI001663490E|nr:NUDIX domain-containing protein [Microlunatus endophyticus]